MRSRKILGCLTGNSLRRMILTDHRMIEKWSDDEKLLGENRDRLGFKERRFQAMLYPILRRRGYNVIVEGYFLKSVRSKGHKSCDLYVYDPANRQEYWVEIKSYSLESGGKLVLRGCLLDLAKMLVWKKRNDIAIFWLIFYGDDRETFKKMFNGKQRSSRIYLSGISKGQIKAVYRSGNRGIVRNPLRRLDQLLGNFEPMGAWESIYAIDEWIKRNGGRTNLVPVSNVRSSLKPQWVKYGIFCGMMK